MGAFREVYNAAKPVILVPVMTVEVVAPSEFQSVVIGGLNQRRGTIVDSEIRGDGFTAIAEVVLKNMFGYSSPLRGITQGKSEISMEYRHTSQCCRRRSWRRRTRTAPGRFKSRDRNIMLDWIHLLVRAWLWY